MYWWIFLILSLLCFAAALFFLTVCPRDDLNMPLARFLVPGAVVMLGTLIFGVILTINAIGRHMSAENCANWGHENGRPTKFVSYTWWNYGCVTPDGHGHFIPTTQIIVNIPKKEG